MRRRGLRLPLTNSSHELEESIPLNTSLHHQNGSGEDGGEPSYRQQKGKGRVIELASSMEEPPIFDVGDSDEDGEDNLNKMRVTGK